MTAEGTHKAMDQYVESYNAGPDYVAKFYSNDCTVYEAPSPRFKDGRILSFSDYIGVANEVFELYPDRKMKVISLIYKENLAALEFDWTGTLSQNLGGVLKMGDLIHLQGAMFLLFKRAKIQKHTDYLRPPI